MTAVTGNITGKAAGEYAASVDRRPDELDSCFMQG